MIDALEAKLAALREQETEVRRAVEQARLQAEQRRQLLEADTVEARLARLELNQRAPVGGGKLFKAQVQVVQQAVGQQQPVMCNVGVSPKE